VGSEPAAIAERTIRKTFGEGEAATNHWLSTLGDGGGGLGSSMACWCVRFDLNDTYIGTDPLHPSEVLPTALALCEEKRRSGRDLIEAIGRGLRGEHACQ